MQYVLSGACNDERSGGTVGAHNKHALGSKVKMFTGDIQSLFLSVLLLELVMFYCQTIQLLSSTSLKVVNILTFDPNVCLLCAPTFPPLLSPLHAPDSTYCTNYCHYFIVSVNILSILAVEKLPRPQAPPIVLRYFIVSVNILPFILALERLGVDYWSDSIDTYEQ